MALTSRERLIKTLNHEDPGKVVVDMGSATTCGIHAYALERLRDYLGLEKKKIQVYEPFQLLGRVDDDLREALGIDVVGIDTNCTIYGFENQNWKSWVFPTTGSEYLVSEAFNVTEGENGRTYMHPKGDVKAPPCAVLPRDGYFFDNIVRTPMSQVEHTAADARKDFQYDFSKYTDRQLRYMEDRINFYYNNTEYGLFDTAALHAMGDMAYIPGPGLKHPEGIRDPEAWLVAHYTEPEYVKECYHMQMEVALENLKLLKEIAGDKIQVVFASGTDFGTQKAQYISNDMYREFYAPYQQPVNAWIHAHTNWKVFYHTCGSIVGLLPDLYESGVDILNPVQCSAQGMDPAFLKREWGDKFVFWGGGVNTQKTLPFGTPDEIYDEVMERLKIFAPGGGFVFNTIHNILGPTRPESIAAMFRAVKDYNNMQK
jgi:hypothetical protein